MPKIVFRSANGETRDVNAPGGLTLMEAAVNNGIEGIEGECGGGLSCATCHVYIDPAYLDKITMPLPAEAELLAEISSRNDRSRLACQIDLTAALEGVVVDLPITQGL